MHPQFPSPGANNPLSKQLKIGVISTVFGHVRPPFSVWLEVQVFDVVAQLLPSWRLCTPRECCSNPQVVHSRVDCPEPVCRGKTVDKPLIDVYNVLQGYLR